MYKIICLLLTLCILSSCETDSTVPFLSIPDDEAQIIEMDVEVGLSANFTFSPVVHASQMVVNYGDGSLPFEFVNSDSIDLGTSHLKPLKYTYPQAGDYNVDVKAIKITKLDISMDSVRQSINKLRLENCHHLKALSCKDQELQSLEIEKSGVKVLDLGTLSALETLSISDCDSLLTIVLNQNPILKTIQLSGNSRLSVLSLNALFWQLPTVTEPRNIILHNNAGDAACDKSIATDKGWTVKIE